MIRLPPFERLRPNTFTEASQMLEAHEGEAMVLGGGTDILAKMKKGITRPNFLVDLSTVSGARYVDYKEKGGLRIGSMTTLTELETSRVLQERFPLLAKAAGQVGSRQLRNMGTIGGNLSQDTRCWYYLQSSFGQKCTPPCFKRSGDVCHVVKGGDRCYALFMGDMAPALIALGATVKICESQGEKVIPLETLYAGDGKRPLRLEPHHILAEVEVPVPPPNSAGTYLKLRQRSSVDFPIVGVGAMVRLDGKKCLDARIALTGVGPAPLLLQEAGEILKQKEISPNVIEDVAQAASREASPVSHMDVPAGYKREMVQVYVKRALNRCLEKVKSNSK